MLSTVPESVVSNSHASQSRPRQEFPNPAGWAAVPLWVFATLALHSDEPRVARQLAAMTQLFARLNIELGDLDRSDASTPLAVP